VPARKTEPRWRSSPAVFALTVAAKTSPTLVRPCGKEKAMSEANVNAQDEKPQAAQAPAGETRREAAAATTWTHHYTLQCLISVIKRPASDTSGRK
jgi:hypothetical protein